MSERAKLHRLLTELTFGDRASSQLLCEMKELCGGKFGTKLIQSDKIHEVYRRGVAGHIKPGGPAAAYGGSANSHHFRIGGNGRCFAFGKYDHLEVGGQNLQQVPAHAGTTERLRGRLKNMPAPAPFPKKLDNLCPLELAVKS